MIRGVLTSFVALVIIGAGIGLGGPSHPNPAQASSHVVRSLSDQTVEPGGRLTVTISASQYGDYAELMETLPEGFSFVSSDQPANALEITEAGRQVRIILLGPSRTVSYNMAASHVAGRHTISGLFRDEAKLESRVAGDDTVEVLGDTGTQTEPSRDVADGEGDDVADDVADGEGDDVGDDVADDVADDVGDDVADDVADGEEDTRSEDDVETEDEGGVETGGEAGEAELGELEETEQGDSDMTDGTAGEPSGGEVTEDDDAQGAVADAETEEDEEPAVVWTTAGTGGRADISRNLGTSNPALGAAGGEEFPVWLMLLLGLGGAIEVALIITVVRTRMWLALRV